jgi:LytS/YehU family sensor histidine kinase
LDEKNSLMNRMTELEQASLRAQMNPHFIFNCLNSIQYFILKGDIRQTNRYIAQFGNLIRQTLDNSAQADISLADEIHYLTNYLELEQMRYSSNFRYEIRVDETIRRDEVYLPSMLLQPFVENAIRHGIRHKQEGIGLVQISIRKEHNNILVSIEDNGVGREAASRYKSQQHIEYQSKGITLTKKRIDILNASHVDKIKTSILDLKDENEQPAGTRILLSFPYPVIEKLS